MAGWIFLSSMAMSIPLLTITNGVPALLSSHYFFTISRVASSSGLARLRAVRWLLPGQAAVWPSEILTGMAGWMRFLTIWTQSPRYYEMSPRRRAIGLIYAWWAMLPERVLAMP